VRLALVAPAAGAALDFLAKDLKMNIVFNFKGTGMRTRAVSTSILLVVLAAAGVGDLASCSGSTPQANALSPAADKVRRLAAILDYVAADYAGAVKDGFVVDAGEFKEQLSFVHDAEELAARLPSKGSVDAVAGVAQVRALVEARAPATELAETAHALRRRLLQAHGVVLAPATPPSRSRGAELFAQACAPCHGPTGAGDGPAGKNLRPAPRNFHDPEAMSDLSPGRAFNGLTDGIKGTAMPSWGALSPADRWSLAFYVFTLRHTGGAAPGSPGATASPSAGAGSAGGTGSPSAGAGSPGGTASPSAGAGFPGGTASPSAAAGAASRGREAWERARARVPATLANLAESSDGVLLQALAAAGLDDSSRTAALGWLRTEAPYRTTGTPLDGARQLLAAALSSYRSGDAATARQGAGQAYLDGFEPHEGTLRARDAGLVTRCEDQFLKIRNDMTAGVPFDQVERDALQLGALLDRAEETLTGTGGARMAFLGSLVVILREGVEAALLIMLLLGLTRKGGGERDPRAVHMGWLVAVVVGVATWFASEPLLRLGGASRELMEGVVALFAALALLATGHFVLARIDAKHRVDALKRRLADAGSAGTRRRLVLASLAFVAVYREAFEVVLFLRAIDLDVTDPGTGPAIAAGAAAGALLLIGLVALLLKLGRRLKPAPLLTVMGTLLCVLAFVLTGKGIRSLQEAGLIGIHPLNVPRIEWLGVFPTLQGVTAQIAVILAFAAIAVLAKVRARRARELLATSASASV
jgi:high-affinity iron transporter